MHLAFRGRWSTLFWSQRLYFDLNRYRHPRGAGAGDAQLSRQTPGRVLYPGPPIVPALAVVMGIHVAFIKFGLADTMPGVILVHLIPTTPYMVMVLAGVFANYNPSSRNRLAYWGPGPRLRFVT